MKIKVIQIGGNTQINGITTFLLDYYKEINSLFQFIFINCAERDSNESIKHTITSLGGKIYHVPYLKHRHTNYELYIEELRDIFKEEKPLAVQSNYFITNGLYLKLAFEEDIPIRVSLCMNDKSKYLTEHEKSELQNSRDLIEKFATAKIAISSSAGNFLYGENAFEVLHPLLNINKFYTIKNTDPLYAKYNLSNTTRYSIFIGRICFQKNVEFLIDVIQKCPSNRNFIIVGNGPKKEMLIDIIVSKNLQHRFSFFETYDTNDLINISDSILLPSLFEGLGIALLEAQLVLKPCFASRNVPREVNLGLCNFMDLEPELWASKLNNLDENMVSELNLIGYSNSENVNKFLHLYTEITIISERYIELAKEYLLGSHHVCNDMSMVVKYYKMSHLLGNIRGTFYYALLFFEGQGVTKDIKFAQKLINTVSGKIIEYANKKQIHFTLILADMYSFGLGKKQDFKMAHKFYLEAADSGNAEAMCSLGYMYQVGQGVEKNLAQSYNWYKKSSDLHYLHSIRDLGKCYYYGLGVSINYEKAIECFEIASRQNYAHATCDLAACYLYGNGVTKNSTISAQLFLKAISQDRNRAIRDIISHGINVELLINKHVITEFHREEIISINDIDSNLIVGKTVVVNRHIRYINPSIFYKNTHINKFFVENENEFYHAYGGVLYSKDRNTLIRFPMGSSITIFSIPSHVTTIGDSAFDDCKRLKKVIIPKSVTKIGKWAFHGCDNIVEFSIPKNIQDIGLYAFGSCEKLKKISVDPDNICYKDINGNLFSKDSKFFFQYAIGKKETIFSLPKETRKIEFRAFSDAYRLEEVDCSHVLDIYEKAFYYCLKLNTVYLNKKCRLNGDHIFSNTTPHLDIIRKKHGKVLLVADIHGHIRLDFLQSVINENNICENDIIIILGDAGIVWSTPLNEQVESFYAKIPCKILFLDGNHENHDLLNTFETVKLFGNKVHKILDNVFHLIRGHSYLINGHTFFVFGGAYSIKRDKGVSSIPIWEGEMPNEKEYKRGIQSLKKRNWIFDYILTHQAPQSILDSINYEYSANETVLLRYLEHIKNKAQFKKWYCGHIHQDIIIKNFKSLYIYCEVIK